MAFVGSDFLPVAEMLVDLDIEAEPEERTAIGRAYYAAFLHARSYVSDQIEPILNQPGAHTKVRKLIDPLSPQLAIDLRRLHGWRSEADYHIPHPQAGADLHAVAEAAIELAKDIIAAVDTLPRNGSATT